MYWDGQQWHNDIPATLPPADQSRAQENAAGAQPPRGAVLMPALWAVIAALVGTIAVVGYLLVKQSHRSRPPTAQPAPAAALPTVRPAPTPAQSAPPAPSSGAVPTSTYFKTLSGTSCQVTADQVTCQTCIPGEVITNAYTCTDPAPEVAVNTAGIVDHNPADIGSSSTMQQLSNGQTYHANGWTIVASGGWSRFINDATGHGMAVAAQNFDSY
ncbi:hypothetical protein A5707_08060 [Mycobacterium kyorinense]|uniref:DUF2510 domain-containing protein n=2 Tax=Mycobacterium kyorinense TaxID=487514 RepID=A0A1A2YW26_9MYCO|nr:hypothetical protein A5707_08060 [Mycobacterium kyorinense]